MGLFSLEFPRFSRGKKFDLNEREMGEQTHVPRTQQSSPLLASQPQLTSDELGAEKINVIDRRAIERAKRGEKDLTRLSNDPLSERACSQH